MPNHVRNFISFIDTPIEKQRQVIQETFNKENEELSFDFNKIVPMPKELNIEESSDTDMGLVLYTNDSQYCDILSMEEIQKRFNLRSKTEQKRILSLGEKAFNNIQKYGVKSWYNFAIQKWGTKWNAYDCCLDDVSVDNFKEDLLNLDNITFNFQTAWSAPAQIFDELSKKYPDVTFYIEYADEDIGHNCGYFEIKNGNVLNYSNDQIDNNTNWSKFAFHLIYGDDVNPESYGYDSNYEYSEEVEENYYKKQEIKNKIDNFD